VFAFGAAPVKTAVPAGSNPAGTCVRFAWGTLVLCLRCSQCQGSAPLPKLLGFYAAGQTPRRRSMRTFGTGENRHVLGKILQISFMLSRGSMCFRWRGGAGADGETGRGPIT
jgi:hypothetical protein